MFHLLHLQLSFFMFFLVSKVGVFVTECLGITFVTTKMSFCISNGSDIAPGFIVNILFLLLLAKTRS